MKFASGLIFSLLLSFQFHCDPNREAGLDNHPVMIKNVTADQAKRLVSERKQDPNFVILDLRTELEFKNGHLEDAILLNFYAPDFQAELERLDKNKSYLLYCRIGNRSGKAIGMMKRFKFKEVYHLNSGILGWLAEGLPVVKPHLPVD